jgi:EAL domain-containing protein (putative c-di-GMP-specific phosphodiesterase class I)
MYEAKGSINKIIHRSADGTPEKPQPTGGLLVEMERALRDNELAMYYQPKVRLGTREVVGFEALVRWHHLQRGLVRPGEFLPAIEASPLLDRFTHKTIGLTLAQLKFWRAQSFDVKLSVNISARMLEEPWFVGRVLEQLAQHDATPEALNLELNETALVVNRARVRAVVEQLRAAGIGLSIDDFGAGFTSFASLKEFDAQEIKLGRSFITDLTLGSFNASLVQSLCVLCEAQHIDLVAQGVENATCWETLQNLGCRLGQGYAIAPPMPAGDVPAWLQSWAQAATVA